MIKNTQTNKNNISLVKQQPQGFGFFGEINRRICSIRPYNGLGVGGVGGLWGVGGGWVGCWGGGGGWVGCWGVGGWGGVGVWWQETHNFKVKTVKLALKSRNNRLEGSVQQILWINIKISENIYFLQKSSSRSNSVFKKLLCFVLSFSFAIISSSIDFTCIGIGEL